MIRTIYDSEQEEFIRKEIEAMKEIMNKVCIFPNINNSFYFMCEQFKQKDFQDFTARDIEEIKNNIKFYKL